MTRRSFMAGLGMVGSAVVARSALLLPESMLPVASRGGGLPVPPGIDPNARAHYRYVGGPRLARFLSEAGAHPDVRALSHELRALGLGDRPVATNGLEAYWQDGKPIARILLSSYPGKGGGGGTLIHWSAGGKIGTSLGVWDQDDKDRRVYRSTSGRVGYAARIQRENDGSSVIDHEDGQRHIVPPYPDRLASMGKRGLAAPAPDVVICAPECNWQCTLVCGIICSTVLEQTCVMSAACGPLAPACLAICTLAVVVSCTWDCAQYCGWSCQMVCHIFQDPIGTIP
ncbi:MAG TPA: hypothetical protein VK197_04230 [Verrucomicrobiae bacterium]|nr:hypothetical protein [Verrucomicrobiae bacterium]